MPKRVTDLGNNKFQVRATIGYGDNGKVITKSTTIICPLGEKQAEQELAVLEKQWKKSIVAIMSKGLTISEFIDKWTDEYVKIACNSPTTFDYYKNIRIPVDERIGNLILAKVTTQDLNLFIADMKQVKSKHTKKKLSSRTIKKLQAFLKQIFSAAMKWHYIQENPCDNITIVKLVKPKKQIPSDSEIKKLLDEIRGLSILHQAIFRVIIDTGMRREEIAGLKWCYVDLQSCHIIVEEALVKSSESGTVQKGTKSDAGNRTVEITNATAVLLTKLKSSQLTSDYVFVNPKTKKPFHPDSITHWFSKICARADIGHYTPHSIRHWVCSSLLDASMPVKQVSAFLGHAEAATTLDVYTHILKNTKHSTASVMEQRLSQIINC